MNYLALNQRICVYIQTNWPSLFEDKLPPIHHCHISYNICLPPPTTYPGCQRLFMRGFRFRSKSDPHEKLRPSCLRPSAEHVSACGRRNEAPRRTREKTSGTQGTHHNKRCIILIFNFSWLLQASLEKLKKTLVQTIGQQRRCIMNSSARYTPYESAY